MTGKQNSHFKAHKKKQTPMTSRAQYTKASKTQNGKHQEIAAKCFQ
jgi:hypothetical protein